MFKSGVERQRKILGYLDGILPRSSNDLSAVKLQPSDSVIIFEGFKHSTSPEIPDLARGAISRRLERLGRRVTRNDLSKLPVTT